MIRTLPPSIHATYLLWRRRAAWCATLYLDARASGVPESARRRFKVEGRRWIGAARRLMELGLPLSARFVRPVKNVLARGEDQG